MKLFKKTPEITFYSNSFGQFWAKDFWIVNYSRLIWKDKYGTPRTEQIPHIGIRIFGAYFQILFGDDEWWEQRIWWKHYCNNDYLKAKSTWRWVSHPSNESTWKI